MANWILNESGKTINGSGNSTEDIINYKLIINYSDNSSNLN